MNPANHFRDLVRGRSAPPDCLSFPAGPLLPRQETHSPPLIVHGLSNTDRISLAFKLWPDKKGEQHGPKKSDYTGVLNHLHRLSSQTWHELHGLKEPAPSDMLVAWKPLLQRERTDKTVMSFEQRRSDKIQLIADRLDASLRPRQADTFSLRTFAPPEYRCVCHENTLPSFGPLGAKPSSVDLSRAAFRSDKWRMLLRFWFKQLHSHHGYSWSASTPGKDVHAYHGAALNILQQLRRQPSHPLAPFAAALTRYCLLPPTEPEKAQKWLEKLKANAWDTSDVSLIPALCPSTLDNPSRSRQALLQLSAYFGLLESEIEGVDTLAREVASLMTDPWVTHQIGWKLQELEKMRNRMVDELREDRIDAFQRRVDSMDSFLALLDRRRAMRGYTQLATDTWSARKNRVGELRAHKQGEPA